jgi:hypothetical protein
MQTIARYANENGGILLSQDNDIWLYVDSGDLYEKALAGKFGEIEPYVPPLPPSDEQIASEVRAERDRLLAASDWTQVLDAPVDQDAWAAYRQALRDVPQQEGFPTDVAWPIKP